MREYWLVCDFTMKVLVFFILPVLGLSAVVTALGLIGELVLDRPLEVLVRYARKVLEPFENSAGIYQMLDREIVAYVRQVAQTGEDPLGWFSYPVWYVTKRGKLQTPWGCSSLLHKAYRNHEREQLLAQL